MNSSFSLDHPMELVENGVPWDDALPTELLTYDKFEFIMDQLEKTSFQDAQKYGFYSVHTTDDEELECAACMIGDSDDLNQILFCDRCNIAIHQTCYGVRLIPEGEWYCLPCERELNPKELKCILCGCSDGPLKLTNEDTWVHSQCVLWSNVYKFLEPDCYGRAVSVNGCLPSSHPCSLCKKSTGITIPCEKLNCTVYHHITCAQRMGHAILIEEKNGKLARQSFCKHHAPTEWKRHKRQKDKELKKKLPKLVKRGRGRPRKGELVNIPISPRKLYLGENMPTEECLKYCGGTTLYRALEVLQESVSPGFRFWIPNIYRYWEAKRRKRSGIPLLKRFHPSVVQKTTSQVPKACSLEDLIAVYQRLKSIRENYEIIRTLLNQSRKRERLKKQLQENTTLIFDAMLYPQRYRYSSIVNHLKYIDGDKFFVNHSKNIKDQGFYQRYKVPLDLDLLQERIDDGLYDHQDDSVFFDDLLSIYDNVLSFYPRESPMYYEAQRSKKICYQFMRDEEPSFDTLPGLTITLPKAVIDDVISQENTDSSETTSDPMVMDLC